MAFVGLLNPMVAIPTGDDFPQTSLTTEASLQAAKIVHRESRRQLVEDRVIAAISNTFIAGIYKLALQRLAKGFHLLLKAVLGHQECEVETSLGFFEL